MTRHGDNRLLYKLASLFTTFEDLLIAYKRLVNRDCCNEKLAVHEINTDD